MTEIQTLPARTDPDLDTEHVPQTGEPTAAHIVKTKKGENGRPRCSRPAIYGTPLEALCGYVWVPSRDPKQLPVCEDCKSIYETYRMFNDGLNERPSE